MGGADDASIARSSSVPKTGTPHTSHPAGTAQGWDFFIDELDPHTITVIDFVD
jgi:hypothetical protein